MESNGGVKGLSDWKMSGGDRGVSESVAFKVAPLKKVSRRSEQGVCNFFHIRSVGEETSLHVAFLADS